MRTPVVREPSVGAPTCHRRDGVGVDTSAGDRRLL